MTLEESLKKLRDAGFTIKLEVREEPYWLEATYLKDGNVIMGARYRELSGLTDVDVPYLLQTTFK